MQAAPNVTARTSVGAGHGKDINRRGQMTQAEDATATGMDYNMLETTGFRSSRAVNGTA